MAEHDPVTQPEPGQNVGGGQGLVAGGQPGQGQLVELVLAGPGGVPLDEAVFGAGQLQPVQKIGVAGQQTDKGGHLADGQDLGLIKGGGQVGLAPQLAALQAGMGR